MGLFKKLFKKEETKQSKKSSFHTVKVKEIKRLTPSSVQISFDIPSEEKSTFSFKPGQYINLKTTLNGEEIRRSYSICSGEQEDLAVGIKQIDNGVFSSYANQSLKEGDSLEISAPTGNFTLPSDVKKIVAFVAGSGITPVLSIAKSLKTDQEMHLFYGNKSLEETLFLEDLKALSKINTRIFLSQEQNDSYDSGRLNKEKIGEIIKQDLSILKSDVFMLCGPEELILNTSEVLKMFGVAPEKISYELFTTPVLLKSDSKVEENNFTGTSKVTVILDDEKIEFELKAKGKTILNVVNLEGFDAPYSCKGGVCCTCRAKVLKGKATMDLNYSLTDQEVEEGYILTCQAHPASEEVIISYDA
jgi:ring-1,2-phenylacetyl-CoA epoxidase subunit PaaE